MLFTSGDFRFLSQARLGDILVLETYFFWADYRRNLSADTYAFKLFPGSKLRHQELVQNAQAYLYWFDYKGEYFLKRQRLDQEFVQSAFFPSELIINQFATLTEARLLLLNYQELDSSSDCPDFVECFCSY